MLLFEQRLYEEMKKLIPTTFAAKYHDAMNEAADTWRLPFWDWAMKKPTWNPDNQDDPYHAGQRPCTYEHRGRYFSEESFVQLCFEGGQQLWGLWRYGCKVCLGTCIC
jgi:hypothetical protein